MNELDLKVLREMMVNGRITWSELAGVLGLSAPAAADRVRALEGKGIIQGYSARVQPDAVGLDLLAFIAVTLERNDQLAAFREWVAATPEVLECHHAAGDYDYLLKVRCQNTRALERFISDNLKMVPRVARTHTTIILSTLKEAVELPLGHLEEGQAGS